MSMATNVQGNANAFTVVSTDNHSAQHCFVVSVQNAIISYQSDVFFLILFIVLMKHQ
jgi:hypothetical protein